MAITYVGGATGSTTGTGAITVSLLGLSGGSDTSPSAGDLVIVAHNFSSTSDGNPGVTTTGYTEIVDLYANGSTRDANFSVNWKIMGSTPDTSVDTTAASGVTAKTCVVMVFRGVDATTPMDVTATTSTGTTTLNQTAYPTPTITPLAAGAIVVSALGPTLGSSTGAFTQPSSYTTSLGLGGGASGGGTWMGYRTWTSGATGAENWTRTTGTVSAGDSFAAVTMALRPGSTTPIAPGNRATGFFMLF
jgi:hypothetical protein